jgi:hypothetical protein
MPNIPASITRATSLIIGEATRKVKVIPSGTPASTNQRKSGTALQEQNGVIIQRSPANKCPVNGCLFARTYRIFSGGRNVRMIDTTKIITESRINIFIVSKMKKSTALHARPVFASQKTV